ncbi:phosphotriesterase family protein [Streptomyces tsukubensis]|uniref:Phosphotriesterase n=1 Tax=Streptomyces tsukubensis TaxID=83656 RepID=A0A1V4A5J5_9ACTN|nr:phosphotriesterase [Streptomyces tsukubensis]OON76389.1 phosphotriesterase [Streptomyces tsukubensis]QFR95966.1 phosphotriesterase [Streptomyces tsukubensis]
MSPTPRTPYGRDVIHTVTGPLSVGAVRGPVLAHEHVALDLDQKGDGAAVLDARHADAVAAELAELRDTFGLELVIELTCRGMGRDVEALARISRASGVSVIAATGWYYEPFHTPEIADSSVEQLTEALLLDIEGGLGSDGVRPGVLGEIGSHGDRPSDPEIRSLRAAARAGRTARLSVATHAQLGRGGLAQLDLLTAEGLPPQRVSIGHQDLLDDPAVHREIAARGAYVAFDTVGKESYQSDDVRLRLLLSLLEAGHADRALLSCDISRHGYLRREGGQGYGHLFDSFLPKARAAGVDDDLIDLMTRRNPLRFLTGADVEEI